MNAAPQSEDRSHPRVRLIQSQAELESLFDRFKNEPLLAIDTEAASFHRFHDRVYLLQLSSRRETAVVDPLAVTSLAPLGAVLADPGVEIVFHDADYDLRLLNLQYGFQAANLFDTRVAAQLLNEPGVGLAALLERYLDVRLDKRYQRADWSARPLSAEMLDYAAADTHHLPQLRDLLREQLRARGRIEWAEEEFALATRSRWSPPDAEEPAYLRLKGAKALPGRSLAVLRELFAWRDQLARRTDKAAFRILNNEPMLLMAKSPPGDMAELKAVRGIGGEQAERRGREILAAVQRGLAVAERGSAPGTAPAAAAGRPGLRGKTGAAEGCPEPARYPVRSGSWGPLPQWHAGDDCPHESGKHRAAGSGSGVAALAVTRDRRWTSYRAAAACGIGVRTRGTSAPSDPSSRESSRDPTPARLPRTALLPYLPPPA